MPKKLKKSVTNGMVNEDIKINGKVALVTGANTGIGYETALDLSRRGAKVLLGCRNLERAEEAKRKITEEVPDSVVLVKKLDLSSLTSVRECAKDIIDTEERLDILVNNAGLGTCYERCLTEDGFELQFGVNHVGHFLLTNLLLDLLKKSVPSRIVIVSSVAYRYGEMKWDDMMMEKDYGAYDSYANAKLANVLHCRELTRRLEGTGVTCNSLHPGFVRTEMSQGMGDGRSFRNSSCCWSMVMRLCFPIAYWTGLTPKQGAQTSIYCTIAPELDGVSGKFFNQLVKENLQPHALRHDDAERLWKMSEEWTQKGSRSDDVTKQNADSD